MLSIQKSNEPTDWWDEMETGQRERLDISILQADQGLAFPNTEAEKKLEKWTR